MAKNLGVFMSLHETGHVRLRHGWRSMDGSILGRSMTKRTPFANVGESGLPIYETEPCRSRGCWACQHKARRKLRSKVQRFIDDVVMKMQRRGARVHGFYTIEFEGGGEDQWHTHVHMLMRWRRRIDYNELKKLWTESVDRPMRKQLAKWTDNQFTNDQRVVQVDAITTRGIADYCTKVTNYVTKGPKSDHVVSEIGRTLYRRRTTGWLGDYYGGKKIQDAGVAIPPG